MNQLSKLIEYHKGLLHTARLLDTPTSVTLQELTVKALSILKDITPKEDLEDLLKIKRIKESD